MSVSCLDCLFIDLRFRSNKVAVICFEILFAIVVIIATLAPLGWFDSMAL